MKEENIKIHVRLGLLIFVTGLLIGIGCLYPRPVAAQSGPPRIESTAPSQALQGETGVVVTFALTGTVPPYPGPTPTGAYIGSIAGDNISRLDTYMVRATFDIPATEVIGVKDASVIFPAPPPTSTLEITGTYIFAVVSPITLHKTVAVAHTPAELSDALTYTLVLSNSGASDLTVTLTDTLPAGVIGTDLAWTGVVTAGQAITFTVSAVLTDDVSYTGRTIRNTADYTYANGQGADDAAFTVFRDLDYWVIDTAQEVCYDDAGTEVTCPASGQSFYGQDAQYDGPVLSYTDDGNGTVTDNNTGLIWQKTPDFTRYEFYDADDYCAGLTTGGHTDWRLPTIKELYSLADFRGELMGSDTAASTPYIDTDYFDFQYNEGAESYAGQYWSSTVYTKGAIVNGNQEGAFGFNFADGHLKAYPTGKDFNTGDSIPSNGCYVRCVHGVADSYGVNAFTNNGDGTVSDSASALMWEQSDGGITRTWESALNYCEGLTQAGYEDWRLPNVKELQSIVDYEKTTFPAIATDVFSLTYDNDWTDSWFWSSTTHGDNKAYASYVTFGPAYSKSGSQTEYTDWHGAGAQRSDPKTGNPDDYNMCSENACDQVRIYNYTRCVRDIVYTEPLLCWATVDSTTVYSSTDASAVQDAVDAATAGDTIKIAGTCAGVQTRSSLTQTVYLSQSVTLQGGYTSTNWLADSDPDTYPTILDAEQNGRVLYIPNSNYTITLDGLTIQNGYIGDSGDGGGIWTRDTLTVTNSIIQNNYAGDDGGGIFFGTGSVGYVAATNLTNNQVSSFGAGFYSQLSTIILSQTQIYSNTGLGGGGVASIRDDMTIVNSAIYSNTGTGQSGGINIQEGNVSLINSTISNNSSPNGAGIINASFNSAYTSTVVISYTTIASNTGANGFRTLDVGGAARSYLFASLIAHNDNNNCQNSGTDIELDVTGGYNLDSDGSCVTDGVDNNITSASPGLETLQDNGGDTWTHALQASSPAIDAGGVCAAMTDQRGYVRDDLACDIGAFEVQHADSDTVIKTGMSDGTQTSFGPTFISVTVTSGDAGTITVTKHATTPGGLYDSGELTATWYISASTGPFSATVAFCYTDAEIVGMDEASLRAFRWDADTLAWTVPVSTGLAVNEEANCLVLTGIEEFSAWTLKDVGQGADSPTSLLMRDFWARNNGVSLFSTLLLSSLLVIGGAWVLRRNMSDHALVLTDVVLKDSSHSYTPPHIIHEGELEIQAGSPLMILPDFEDGEDLEW